MLIRLSGGESSSIFEVGLISTVNANPFRSHAESQSRTESQSRAYQGYKRTQQITICRPVRAKVIRTN